MLLPIRLAVAMTRMMPHLHGRERIRSLRRICANQLQKDLAGKNLVDKNLTEENLTALQTKTAPLCKAGLFIYLAS